VDKISALQIGLNILDEKTLGLSLKFLQALGFPRVVGSFFMKCEKVLQQNTVPG
jgi:hypothetical protein